MSGYTKNIAVIKGIRSGFSTDGGALSGLIKTEKYGPFFRAEVSYINFAPLTSGRYVTAVSDGEHTVILDGLSFEGESPIDTSYGFASLVCFVNGEVLPIASAVCGDYGWATAACAREIENAEKIKDASSPTKYEDEAIAEENYYEYSADTEGQGALRQAEDQKDGRGAGKNEDAGGIFQESEAGCAENETAAVNSTSGEETVDDIAAAEDPDPQGNDKGAKKERGRTLKNGWTKSAQGKDGEKPFNSEPDEAERIPLATDLKFYERMQGEIEKLLAQHPHEEALERMVENSRWVRVSYGKGMHYVFGVINDGAAPSYICYGVPGEASECPAGLSGMAGFIPADEKASGGYWVMYQDARTGASVKLNSV